MIPYPYHLPSFLISENDISAQPLDLSLSTLEKRVMQQFNDQVPIEKISQKLDTSIPAICKIIERKFSYINTEKPLYQPICTNYCKGASPIVIEKLKDLLYSRQ